MCGICFPWLQNTGFPEKPPKVWFQLSCLQAERLTQEMGHQESQNTKTKALETLDLFRTEQTGKLPPIHPNPYWRAKSARGRLTVNRGSVNTNCWSSSFIYIWGFPLYIYIILYKYKYILKYICILFIIYLYL